MTGSDFEHLEAPTFAALNGPNFSHFEGDDCYCRDCCAVTVFEHLEDEDCWSCECRECLELRRDADLEDGVDTLHAATVLLDVSRDLEVAEDLAIRAGRAVSPLVRSWQRRNA